MTSGPSDGQQDQRQDPRVHYSFVVDAPQPMGYQAYLLARSLITLGEVVPGHISAHLVSGTDVSVEVALRELGVHAQWVEPFGHPYCNRLQQLPFLDDPAADQVVLLDTDMFAIRKLELPARDAVWGKNVDAPNPPIEVLEAIFEAAGLSVVSDETDVLKAPTVRGNFNGGLYVVPTPLLADLSAAWVRWASWSLERIELYRQWYKNVDQVSFALAVAELDLPIGSLPRAYNTPTHLGPRAVGEMPFFLHYHRELDEQLLLKPTGEQTVDAAVDVANRTIVGWRRDELCNPLFWSARYALHPELGSGAGSRGSVLALKQTVLRRLIELTKPRSIVDIGGGDGTVLEGLAEGLEHRATDVSASAADVYLARNPTASFTCADICAAPASAADLAVCLDVLIHLADPVRFRDAVRNVVESGLMGSLVSGFDQQPSQPGNITYFHEPLLEVIEDDPAAVAYPIVSYRELIGYFVQRDGSTGHPRDAQPGTLRRAMPFTPDPLTLLECVIVSRREIGFFPDHLPRCIEYPWVLRAIRATGRSGQRVLDVGAGVNVLPLILADDGHRVTTVDHHHVDRTAADRSTWTEWGYLDFSRLRPQVASYRVDYEAFSPPQPFDVIYSVSVVEHLPSEIRRLWFARMAAQIVPDGLLLLTVDLLPMSRSLWLRSEGVDVEPAADHGDIDDVLDELRDCGFQVDTVEVREWLPLSRVAVALISARRATSAGFANVLPSTAPRAARPWPSAGSSPPAVTVLVPAYRPGDRFIDLLGSMSRQTYGNVTVRVSVDYAPDHTLPQLPDLGGKRLDVVHQSSRLGWVGNVNALLSTVETPYFLMLMHDDQLTPEYLEAAIEVLQRQPEVVVAHGSTRHHGIRDGDMDTTPSISGERMERVMTFLDRAPHRAGLAWRGVIRAELLASGLRLRTRLSDGQFSNDLLGLEAIVHGASAFVPGIYYDKFTDQWGLSREYHRRTHQQRSAMLADNLACLMDILREGQFSRDEQFAIASRYALWLLGLQSNWNVVSAEQNSDQETYVSIRPAIADFVANTALSMAAPPEGSVQSTPGRIADRDRSRFNRK